MRSPRASVVGPAVSVASPTTPSGAPAPGWCYSDICHARASLRTIAEGTGLSKRAVQAALRTLGRRRLIRVRRAGPTAVPEYLVQRPWAERRSA